MDIKAKLQKMSELYDELEQSRAIETLWPNCFKNGSVKAAMVGTGHYGGLLEPSKFKLRITCGNEVKEFPFDSVPVILTNKHLTLAIESTKLGDRDKEFIKRKSKKYLLTI